MIDLADIRPGGKVSVTLADGTKVIDSPVIEGRSGDYEGTIRIINGFFILRNGRNWPGGTAIVSIDAYTPPKPEWDRPEVFAVTDVDGFVWTRTKRDGMWRARGNSVGAIVVERDYGPCTVLAVYAG